MNKDNKKWRAGHIFREIISCQKHLTELYNLAAIEASSEALRQDFLSILEDEHQLHNCLFQVMQRRGLYAHQFAQGSELAIAQQNFTELY